MSAMFGIEPEFDEAPRSSRRLRRLKRRLRQRPDGELNIVSMIDVFAVMVFFLLVGSSVSASKLHALKLSLPSVSEQPLVSDEPALDLAVNLFEDYLEIVSSEGLRKKFPKVGADYDTAGLTQALIEIKKDHPTESKLTLFIAEDIAYADIVAVMDSSREYPDGSVAVDGSTVLFPSISMGDAPVDNNGAKEIQP
ncbi:biopolymer transporter ExbD [Zhongshania borealis]|uniref:Biopolymer transporter ExbD n=1 Tax=Zhongshania borealis TaxID=889488 RepID=A0ABP7X808_9GAMM